MIVEVHTVGIHSHSRLSPSRRRYSLVEASPFHHILHGDSNTLLMTMPIVKISLEGYIAVISKRQTVLGETHVKAMA